MLVQKKLGKVTAFAFGADRLTDRLRQCCCFSPFNSWWNNNFLSTSGRFELRSNLVWKKTLLIRERLDILSVEKVLLRIFKCQGVQFLHYWLFQIGLILDTLILLFNTTIEETSWSACIRNFSIHLQFVPLRFCLRALSKYLKASGDNTQNRFMMSSDMSLFKKALIYPIKQSWLAVRTLVQSPIRWLMTLKPIF